MKLLTRFLTQGVTLVLTSVNKNLRAGVKVNSFSWKGHRSGEAKSKINTKIALVCAYEELVMTLRITLYFLHDIMDP